MNQPPVSAAARQAAVTFIFITVVLDVLALGIIVPVLPPLVVAFLGGNTARAAEIYGLFATAWALMQFVASPVLGALSDRFGRRPIILLSVAGLGLDYILMALAPTLGWLFVGRVISGVTSASFATAAAYIADVTPPEQRARSFGIIGAAFGLGFVLGPVMGGLLGTVNPRLPFWVSAALCLTNVMYGLFVLPESLPPERRSRGRGPTRSARCACCDRTRSCSRCRASRSSTTSRTKCCRARSCSIQRIAMPGRQERLVLPWPSSASARPSFQANWSDRLWRALASGERH